MAVATPLQIVVVVLTKVVGAVGAVFVAIVRVAPPVVFVQTLVPTRRTQ